MEDGAGAAGVVEGDVGERERLVRADDRALAGADEEEGEHHPPLGDPGGVVQHEREDRQRNAGQSHGDALDDDCAAAIADALARPVG